MHRSIAGPRVLGCLKCGICILGGKEWSWVGLSSVGGRFPMLVAVIIIIYFFVSLVREGYRH